MPVAQAVISFQQFPRNSVIICWVEVEDYFPAIVDFS